MQEYPWQKPYHAAILETDYARLQVLVWQAEVDIEQRLNDGSEISAEEAFTMAQTTYALAVLAQERLGRNLSFKKANGV